MSCSDESAEAAVSKNKAWVRKTHCIGLEKQESCVRFLILKPRASEYGEHYIVFYDFYWERYDGDVCLISLLLSYIFPLILFFQKWSYLRFRYDIDLDNILSSSLFIPLLPVN